EDGIRDRTVTGVQTCALPISGADVSQLFLDGARVYALAGFYHADPHHQEVWAISTNAGEQARLVLRPEGWIATFHFPWFYGATRSEERRVGKECREKWATED